MLGFTVTTGFNAGALLGRCSDVFSAAVGVLGDAVVRDCEMYVPYDTGRLCRSVCSTSVTAGEGTHGCDVIWSAPHANAVYYGDTRGVRYRTEHHAHARARWFEGAKASFGEQWAETVRTAVRGAF